MADCTRNLILAYRLNEGIATSNRLILEAWGGGWYTRKESQTFWPVVMCLVRFSRTIKQVLWWCCTTRTLHMWVGVVHSHSHACFNLTVVWVKIPSVWDTVVLSYTVIAVVTYVGSWLGYIRKSGPVYTFWTV